MVNKYGTIPYVRFTFLLVCYSNFVSKTHCFFYKIFDFKNAMTLKTWLGYVKVIENVTIP